MELDVYDEPRARNHKTRLAKVELYLEVPTSDEDGKLLCEDGTLNCIENALAKKGITYTSFGDINLSPIFDDYLSDFKDPVGYLAPDGKFYLLETDDDRLAHISLAPIVEEAYKDTIDYRYMHSTYGLDYDLEKAGFIKVHCSDVRYLAHWPVGTIQGPRDTYDDNRWLDTPDPTEAQKAALIEYAKRFNLEGSIHVNEHYYDLDDFIRILKQGDEIAIRNMFKL